MFVVPHFLTVRRLRGQVPQGCHAANSTFRVLALAIQCCLDQHCPSTLRVSPQCRLAAGLGGFRLQGVQYLDFLGSVFLGHFPESLYERALTLVNVVLRRTMLQHVQTLEHLHSTFVGSCGGLFLMAFLCLRNLRLGGSRRLGFAPASLGHTARCGWRRWGRRGHGTFPEGGGGAFALVQLSPKRGQLLHGRFALRFQILAPRALLLGDRGLLTSPLLC
mmetsp:Transcript_50579/g.147031  ORF Transcript_50579/g.147031 Transcript_50579/m.147031 type:complete len:219 (+) Transcript_50579:1184-1840(+)